MHSCIWHTYICLAHVLVHLHYISTQILEAVRGSAVGATNNDHQSLVAHSISNARTIDVKTPVSDLTYHHLLHIQL